MPKGQSEHDFLKDVQILLIAVVSWFVVTTAGELIGNQANETTFGQTIGRYVLVAAVVVVPLAIVAWVVLYLRARRKEPVPPAEESDPDPEPDDEWTAPPEPSKWHRPHPLYGRDSEVKQAVQTVLDTGVVAVVGPRDVGTSAVAEAVVQKLIDEHDADANATTRFDLRSRSSRRPDDARAAAGRIVSSFGLDEPADDTAPLLSNAGRRLVSALRERYDVLMLDNASAPEEVEWLIREWPAEGGPWLVVAGESAIGAALADSTVFVGELDLPGLRAIWDAEFRAPDFGLRDWLRTRIMNRWGGHADLDALLRACFGRPRAVKAFAREILRPDSTVTIESLLTAVNSTAVNSTGPVNGPLERVWTAILDHVRDGLSEPAVWLLHSLAQLPVTALTKTAIGAMLTAHRDTAGGPVADDTDVLAPLEELRIRNLVQETDGRCRLPQEIRRALAGTTSEADRRAFALQSVPALLRHHVEQAGRWAARLGCGAAAGEWFHDAERSLRPLFNKDSYVDEQLLELVIEDLARVADALEAWYVREQQSGGLLAVNDGLHTLAERANRPDLAGVAVIRMATAHRMAGRLGDADAMLDVAAAYAPRLRADQAAELDVREHIERALVGMTGSGRINPDREGLARAESELSRIFATHRNHPSATAALINLGALCLRLGRPADALNHLRRAERLAIDRRDIGCQAHTIELQGVALSHRADQLADAVRLWRHAKELFGLLGEEQGEARCLQHLGSAALVDPTVAGRLRDGRPTALGERAAAEVALRLLEDSKKLRAGQPDTELIDHYLDIARRRLGSTTSG